MRKKKEEEKKEEGEGGGGEEEEEDCVRRCNHGVQKVHGTALAEPCY